MEMGGDFRCVGLSPDGRLAATTAHNSTATIWDVASGEVVRTLVGHDDLVYSVRFSPDGAVVATASEDGTVGIWDVDTGGCVRKLSGHGSPVRSVDFSPDGRVVVTGSDDETARVWDVGSGACLKILTQQMGGHSKWLWSVAFAPDGGMFATASEDGLAKLWDSSRLSSGAASRFFASLAMCCGSNLDGVQALQRLAGHVTEVSELKVFFTLASIAVKAGDVTAAQGAAFLRGVLGKAAGTFRFDARGEVKRMLVEVVLPRCVEDGVFDKAESATLEGEFDRTSVFPGYRYRRIEETVALMRSGEILIKAWNDLNETVNVGALYASDLGERLHRVEDLAPELGTGALPGSPRPRAVARYAYELESQLRDFHELSRSHPKKAAIFTVAALVSFVPFLAVGMGTIFDEIVDLSSVPEAVQTAVDLAGSEDRIMEAVRKTGGYWARKKLRDLVDEYGMLAPHVAALGVVKLLSVADDGDALQSLDHFINTAW
eukprot:CAMPEP_0184722928 /NCGR_PEP_ID=MMETSP0314-20130426/23646_1 /TAXON_ID=38298 /ORGANISM="Rhodella maculata, Strain CCMP 736" /LENGTH=488 /DNA_ID=CAMNT_0027187631 /DNA_START=1 /DNA_END=1464 /DNA_ORIENTATION=+